MNQALSAMAVMPRGRLCAVSGVILFAAALVLNGPLTSTMTRHMFAHIPMLLFSGMLVAYGLARSEEHTSELQSLMRISYAVFCLKKKNIICQSSTSSNTTI